MNNSLLKVGICGLILAFSLSVAAQTSTFTDSRDGQKYRTVKIGKQTWMAENLNFKTGNSWCYENQESNCQKYGRLYNLATAFIACPTGWHLPNDDDWNSLTKAVGGKRVEDDCGCEYEYVACYYWDIAGGNLKSKTNWNGTTDQFGFSALPGGARIDNGNFDLIGQYAYWWGANNTRSIGPTKNIVREDGFFFDDNYGFSVRCVKE